MTSRSALIAASVSAGLFIVTCIMAQFSAAGLAFGGALAGLTFTLIISDDIRRWLQARRLQVDAAGVTWRGRRIGWDELVAVEMLVRGGLGDDRLVLRSETESLEIPAPVARGVLDCIGSLKGVDFAAGLASLGSTGNVRVVLWTRGKGAGL